MARRKMWFLSRLWLVMDRSRAILMLAELGLTNDQIRAVIKRFWDGVPIKSIGELTVGEHNKLMPVWDNWVKNWCFRNIDDFKKDDRLILFSDDDATNE